MFGRYKGYQINIVITGGNGFIGKNLQLGLVERGFNLVTVVTRMTSEAEFKAAIHEADVVFHLAGEMRSTNDHQFVAGNIQSTKQLCSFVSSANRPIKIVFTSSISVDKTTESAYSKTKLQAEDELKELSHKCNVPISIYRLPHVFGKWAKPFYNSFIVTSCYSVSRGLPVTIHDPSSVIYPLYIDNLIDQLSDEIYSKNEPLVKYPYVENVRSISIGELYEILRSFADMQADKKIGEVGSGLLRELYATYISYLPEDKFSYPLSVHSDSRGVFVEFLKTKSSGQISFFTAKPGVSRGNHYHHTKTEKFLVVHGRARFAFRNLLDGKIFHIDVSSDEPTVVGSIPGWVHNVSNIGDGDLVVMLWSNEVFDKLKPDTTYSQVNGADLEKA